MDEEKVLIKLDSAVKCDDDSKEVFEEQEPLEPKLKSGDIKTINSICDEIESMQKEHDRLKRQTDNGYNFVILEPRINQGQKMDFDYTDVILETEKIVISEILKHFTISIDAKKEFLMNRYGVEYTFPISQTEEDYIASTTPKKVSQTTSQSLKKYLKDLKDSF